jgi:hypothetical protein
MKIKFINLYTILFGVFILLGAFSCQTEPLNSEQSVSDDSSSSNKKPNEVPTFDWSCEAAAASEVILYAGQNIDVGTVNVAVVGDNYEITYNITNDNYCLSQTHLSVVTNKADFPITKTGNPIPGQFEYSESHDCVKTYTYTVPTSKGTYIAAHAVVNCISDVETEGFEATLPDEVDVCVTDKGEGAVDSYFNITIDPENSLTGDYNAWCADVDLSLENGQCFTGDVYSSYETLPEGKFEHPENFGAVNWLMNQDFIGTEATPELGNYTKGDIQIAIWRLVDDGVCIACNYTGPYDNDRIDMLVAWALGNTDFVPSCGENVVIIIVPNDNKQPIFITIPAPCGDCEETAMGAGCDFPGNNWFTYFQYGS